MSYYGGKKYKLPPRLPGLPIVGNTFQIPPFQGGLWASEQAKKMGEMFTCKIGVNTWVFLNSSRVVNDLMEKRSAIYSSRTNLPMTDKIMSGGNRILLMPYSDRWRALRKIMHSILNKTKGTTFQPFQDLESKHLIYDYLHNPDKWHNANQRFANSVIMSVVFGKRMELGDPKTRELLETSSEILGALQPGASIADVLPMLENLPKPLQWWRPSGERAYQKCLKVYRREVEELREKEKNGTARECFATEFLRNPETAKWGEEQTLFALGSLMEAGSDTSRMAISILISAAATDERWVITAREALDSVCGSNAERLPDVSDKPRLQYITAAVKEAFRWRPFAEIGVPHMLTQDDEYEGYKFPAGTLFTWNALHIALNEEEYEDAQRFWPERFLNADLNNVMKGHWSFGPGRRACSGYNVGESNVWIALARLLYCFDFNELPGQPIKSLEANWLEHRWAPFPVEIKVRSPAHAALVDREGKVAAETKY
ncbi:cytochrome P450 [Acephala macrosclerotiorum]|nr:cytochrome P450 [Acephala macrosclerotiorum]